MTEHERQLIDRLAAAWRRLDFPINERNEIEYKDMDNAVFALRTHVFEERAAADRDFPDDYEFDK